MKQVTITLTDKEYEKLERLAEICEHDMKLNTFSKCAEFMVSDSLSKINLSDFEKKINDAKENINYKKEGGLNSYV